VARQVNVGDYILLGSDIEGYVHDITWRYTTIKTIADNLVVVPNSKMASSLVSNFSLPIQELSIKLEVGVSYESDLEHVENVTLDVAREVHREIPGCVREYEPKIRYKTFGDSSINFIVILRVSEFEEKFIIQHEFVKRLHRRFNSEGIVIPFPIRTVHLKNLSSEDAGRH
jgi:small-conductance mechanosensitive channel